MEMHHTYAHSIIALTLLLSLAAASAQAQDAEAPPVTQPSAPPADAPAEAPPAEESGEQPGDLPTDPAPAPAEPPPEEGRLSASMSLDDFAGDGDSTDDGSPLQSGSGFIVGAKVGGGIGTSEFGATFVLELEVGYALPFANRALELFVSGQYTQPETDGVEGSPNPSLPGDGSFKYEVTQQELSWTLGALYRIDIGSDLLMPYGGAGARMYMLNTKVKGDASGEAFGENEETQNDFGLVLLAGVDIFLGPGALLAELSWGYAALDGYIMRDTDVGQLNLAVGYRLML